MAQDVYYLAFPFLILWSFCFLVLRLIEPRPAWSTLFRQPGWWACLGSILAALAGITVEYLLWIRVPSVILPVSVLGVWIALGVSRMWRAERSWFDRGGRVVGMLWIGTIPIYLVGFVFSRV